MSPWALASLRFLAVLFALAVLAVPAIACSGGSGGSGGGPEGVARAAMQAMVNGDEAAFLDQVRPDDRLEGGGPRFESGSEAVSGCDLGGAEVLVEQTDISHVNVSVVFKQPCGDLAGRPVTKCLLPLTQLSERWFLEHRSGTQVSCY